MNLTAGDHVNGQGAWARGQINSTRWGTVISCTPLTPSPQRHSWPWSCSRSRTSTGFEPMTSRFRCNALTNWAMKPLTLGAGHLWVLMVPWGMNGIWNGIWNESYELRIWNQVKLWSSQLWTQFLQLRTEAWKISGLQRGLNPWPRDSGATL